MSALAGVWPGYDLAAIPMVLVSVGAEGEVGAVVAFNHPNPEALGPFAGDLNVDGHRVVVVEDPADPDHLASMAPFRFFADIGGVDTLVVVGQRGDTLRDPDTPQFAALVAHEAFHRYQLDEWVLGTFALDADGLARDVAGYDFSVWNLELVLLESRILIAAYQAESLADTERLARQFAAVRSVRHDRDPRVALDEYQERMEGSARYIEHRIGTRSAAGTRRPTTPPTSPTTTTGLMT